MVSDEEGKEKKEEKRKEKSCKKEMEEGNWYG